MAQHLAQGGYRIVEATTPSVKRLRGRGKTDAWDALSAARSTLVTELDHLRDRRSGELGATLNILTTAREQLRADKVGSTTALTALLRTHALGIGARRALTKAQIRTVAAWRPRQEGLGVASARAEARHAQHINQLDQELKDNQQRLSALVAEHAPSLLGMFGPGHGRDRSDGVVPPGPDPFRGRLRSDRGRVSDPGFLG